MEKCENCGEFKEFLNKKGVCISCERQAEGKVRGVEVENKVQKN